MKIHFPKKYTFKKPLKNTLFKIHVKRKTYFQTHTIFRFVGLGHVSSSLWSNWKFHRLSICLWTNGETVTLSKGKLSSCVIIPTSLTTGNIYVYILAIGNLSIKYKMTKWMTTWCHLVYISNAPPSRTPTRMISNIKWHISHGCIQFLIFDI